MVQDTGPDILFLVHDLARQVRVEADKRARAQGMTRAQWVILVRVAMSPGLSQRDLADMLEVEPITVGRLVDRLEARGLIERRADPADRRIWRLHLEEAAYPVLDEIERHRRDLRRIVLAGLDPAERDQLAAALGRMKSNLAAPAKDVA